MFCAVVRAERTRAPLLIETFYSVASSSRRSSVSCGSRRCCCCCYCCRCHDVSHGEPVYKRDGASDATRSVRLCVCVCVWICVNTVVNISGVQMVAQDAAAVLYLVGPSGGNRTHNLRSSGVDFTHFVFVCVCVAHTRSSSRAIDTMTTATSRPSHMRMQ